MARLLHQTIPKPLQRSSAWSSCRMIGCCALTCPIEYMMRYQRRLAIWTVRLSMYSWSVWFPAVSLSTSDWTDFARANIASVSISKSSIIFRNEAYLASRSVRQLYLCQILRIAFISPICVQTHLRSCSLRIASFTMSSSGISAWPQDGSTS